MGVVGQSHPSWAHLLTGGVAEFVIRLSLSSVNQHDYTQYRATIRSILAPQLHVISQFSQCSGFQAFYFEMSVEVRRRTDDCSGRGIGIFRAGRDCDLTTES